MKINWICMVAAIFVGLLYYIGNSVIDKKVVSGGNNIIFGVETLIVNELIWSNACSSLCHSQWLVCRFYSANFYPMPCTQTFHTFGFWLFRGFIQTSTVHGLILLNMPHGIRKLFYNFPDFVVKRSHRLTIPFRHRTSKVVKNPIDRRMRNRRISIGFCTNTSSLRLGAAFVVISANGIFPFF